MRCVFTAAALAAVGLSAASARAQEAAKPDDKVFGLGEIIVTRPRLPEALAGSTTTVGSEAIHRFNRNSLDEAVNLLPGVNSSTTGGARNERLIYLRGFDRFQVPLSIDGIRVYLPADNRLDFGRFLTPDVSEIQVSKGYASVLDGPGAMGGAINLVTRKPTQAFEAEARATVSLDNAGDYADHTVFLLAGGRRDKGYVQVSYARSERDHWNLSDDFTPTAIQPAGERLLSGSEDQRINVKLGYTPNATDEYVLSYTRQEGSKNAPPHVTDPLSIQRFWSWPYWNLDSLYFLSTTAVGARATLKTRAYRNTFDNLLRSFNDRTQTTQTLPRAFNSFYEDSAYGASAQLDYRLTESNTLRFAAYYRRDEHGEFQQVFPSAFTEPPQTSIEHTVSLAAEDHFEVSPDVTVTLGVGWDRRFLEQAQDFGTPPEGGASRVFDYRRADADAWNAQGRIDRRLGPDATIHALVSSRARFPTLFERFSSRFGGFISAPDLKAERATQFELGGTRRFGPLHAEGSVWYARVDDAIVQFPLVFQGQAVTQSRNLGEGDFWGIELATDARLGPTLTAGLNYGLVHRELNDPTNAAFRPTGVPDHKVFLYADWTPLPQLKVTPSLEAGSSRFTANTAGTRWYRIGAYQDLAVRADWRLVPGVELGVGVRNLLDQNRSFVDGFPEPGRSVFVSLRART